MISFLQYLTEKKPKYNYSDDELEKAKLYIVKKNLKSASRLDKKDMTYELNKSRNGLKKRLLKADKWTDDLEKLSFTELQAYAKLNNVRSERNAEIKDWQNHESDIRDGINKLFQDGIFVVKYPDGTEKTITDKDNKAFFSNSTGRDSRKSDICVHHNDKSFFVEAKLDFLTSEYFKYGVTINGSTIKYDHKKYLEGDLTIQEKAYIDKLFNDENEIGMSQFLNRIVNMPEIKSSWKLFLDNINQVKWFISQSDEFADFSSSAHFTDEYPHDFAQFSKVFDAYCRHYETLYNELVKKLFDTFDDKSNRFISNDYMFDMIDGNMSHNKNSSYSVFNTIDSLCEQLELDEVPFLDKAKFDKILEQIKLIEAKFNALLKVSGIDGSIDRVNSLADSEKTMYFFKMFLSSAKDKRGKENRGKLLNALTDRDSFGNMQICTDIPVTDDSVAKMITNFYVKKDIAAYIQIADTIYQLLKDWNPLNLSDLPIYSEAARKFLVTLGINNTLTHISLHIRCLGTDIGSKKHLSFKEKDKQFYIGNQKQIYIEIKGK